MAAENAWMGTFMTVIRICELYPIHIPFIANIRIDVTLAQHMM
jgi:hypothetical protein